MIARVKNWLANNAELIAWIGGASIVMLILAAIMLPIVVNRMRADYFLEDRDHERSIEAKHPVWHALGMLGKNLVGLFFLLMGIVMLVTPGQGLLTILIGLLLMDFPGKRKLEIWLVKQPSIYRTINWIREKGGRQPLSMP